MSKSPSHAVTVVREFWQLMATNDFSSVGAMLADDFVLEWPQSRERIRGNERFAQMNFEYPANGSWCFSVCRIIGNAKEASSEVVITDGSQQATAISFFSVVAGKIIRIVEYWPEPYPAPVNRNPLAEPMQ